MATTQIDLTDVRLAKAIEILSESGSWLKCRFKNGLKAYGVPSQTRRGQYHYTTTKECSCIDFKRRAPEPCKHVIACRLHVTLVKNLSTGH